jgi:hypothetical protein
MKRLKLTEIPVFVLLTKGGTPLCGFCAHVEYCSTVQPPLDMAEDRHKSSALEVDL